MLRINPEENLHNQLSAFLERRLRELEQQAHTAQELNLELLQEEQETQRYLKLIWNEVDYLKAFLEGSVAKTELRQKFQKCSPL
jgi:pyrroloquinoline quinone (PQQ) biosynthesis protein C